MVNGKYYWGIKSYANSKSKRLLNREFVTRPMKTLDLEGMISVWAKDRIGSKQREYNRGIKPYEVHCTAEHLIKIFPRDMKCPVLGIKMRFGGNSDASVQLDRIDNNKDYIDGNVAWISGKANRAKGNLNSDELYKIADWLKDKGF